MLFRFFEKSPARSSTAIDGSLKKTTFYIIHERVKPWGLFPWKLRFTLKYFLNKITTAFQQFGSARSTRLSENFPDATVLITIPEREFEESQFWTASGKRPTLSCAVVIGGEAFSHSPCCFNPEGAHEYVNEYHCNTSTLPKFSMFSPADNDCQSPSKNVNSFSTPLKYSCATFRSIKRNTFK